MLLLTQAPNGALSARRHPSASSPSTRHPPSPLFPHPHPSRLAPLHPAKPPALSLPSSRRLSTPPRARDDDTVVVGDEGVPLEGVIKRDRPGLPSRLVSWGQVALLSGGDVLCLLVFAAVGRFSHGFPVLDWETARTADPFISGWLLSAYFLGGYGDDGKGKNGFTKAIVAAAKSWAVGIPYFFDFVAVGDCHQDSNIWSYATDTIYFGFNGKHWYLVDWLACSGQRTFS